VEASEDRGGSHGALGHLPTPPRGCKTLGLHPSSVKWGHILPWAYCVLGLEIHHYTHTHIQPALFGLYGGGREENAHQRKMGGGLFVVTNRIGSIKRGHLEVT
jgi:hypothetical protein